MSNSILTTFYHLCETNEIIIKLSKKKVTDNIIGTPNIYRPNKYHPKYMHELRYLRW